MYYMKLDIELVWCEMCSFLFPFLHYISLYDTSVNHSSKNVHLVSIFKLGLVLRHYCDGLFIDNYSPGLSMPMYARFEDSHLILPMFIP